MKDSHVLFFKGRRKSRHSIWIIKLKRMQFFVVVFFVCFFHQSLRIAYIIIKCCFSPSLLSWREKNCWISDTSWNTIFRLLYPEEETQSIRGCWAVSTEQTANTQTSPKDPELDSMQFAFENHVRSKICKT